MNTFELARTIPFPLIASSYGLKGTSKDMCHCPLHEDRHPSMKIYPDHCYCFSCHTRLDGIALTAKLFNLSLLDAAHKIVNDFSPTNDAGTRSLINKMHEQYIREKNERELLEQARLTIASYCGMLREWKRDFAPKTMEEEFDSRFVYATQNLEYADYLFENLTLEDVKEMSKNGQLENIESWNALGKRQIWILLALLVKLLKAKL